MKERKVSFTEIIVASTPTILTTSGLGSCIAIAIFDKQTQIGALGHILLPHDEQKSLKNKAAPGKYADSAIRKMVSKMLNAGSDLKDLRAKVIGGAMFFNQAKKERKNSSSIPIGRENVQTAKTTLKQLGIPVIALDVGGDYGRRIQFYSHTGKIIVETKNGTREI